MKWDLFYCRREYTLFLLKHLIFGQSLAVLFDVLYVMIMLGRTDKSFHSSNAKRCMKLGSTEKYSRRKNSGQITYVVRKQNKATGTKNQFLVRLYLSTNKYLNCSFITINQYTRSRRKLAKNVGSGKSNNNMSLPFNLTYIRLILNNSVFHLDLTDLSSRVITIKALFFLTENISPTQNRNWFNRTLQMNMMHKLFWPVP